MAGSGIHARNQTWQRAAATDEHNILAKEHWPEYDDIIKEVVVIMQTGREFKEVFSPFKRGPQVSSILHDADFHDGHYVMVGEAGIGYANHPTQWKLSENQPFGSIPVIGCRFGEDDKNEIVCVAVDTQHRIAVSRDFGKTWSPPMKAGPQYDFSCLDYHNRTFTILCHGGQVLRLVWVDGEFMIEEQADRAGTIAIIPSPPLAPPGQPLVVPVPVVPPVLQPQKVVVSRTGKNKKFIIAGCSVLLLLFLAAAIVPAVIT